MKKMIYIILLFNLIFGSISCTPDPLVIKPTNTDSVYSVHSIWATNIYNDTSCSFNKYPKLTDEYFILCSYSPQNTSKLTGIGVYDRTTGERHPAWQDEPNLGFVISDWDIAGENEDVAVFVSGTEVNAYSITTGQFLWNKTEHTIRRIIPSISVYKDLVFICIEPCGDGIWSKLIAINAHTGEEKSILYENYENNYEFRFYPPEVYIEPSGDTLLLFQKRQLNFSTSDGRVDVYAYNMTQDTLKWRIDDITTDGCSSVQESIINNNYFYFQGANSIHCINITAGQIVWEEVVTGESFFQAQNLYANNKIFMLGETGTVYCYDAANGNQIWENYCDANPHKMGPVIAYYDNKLYLNTIATGTYNDELGKSFRCLDAITAEVLWSSDNDIPHYGMIVDETEGIMYGAASQYAYKIDLKTSPIMIPK